MVDEKHQLKHLNKNQSLLTSMLVRFTINYDFHILTNFHVTRANTFQIDGKHNVQKSPLITIVN